ncbi:MAG: hypothetical protein KQA31_02310, partial [Candidatus Aenigmarchaeota archaeon]|nr:hypothetical protein [Candidatus Aenigmarchaeota archaeon]
IKMCYFDSREPWKCLIGEKCICEIEGNCTNGNIAVFYSTMTNTICYPKIKNNQVKIDFGLCDINQSKVNVTAICDEGLSKTKEIYIYLDKLPACIWNTTEEKCQKNPSYFAESCNEPNTCILKEEKCLCLPISSTTLTTLTLTTTSTTILETTTTILEDCPYECCEGIKEYKDLECRPGYVCCMDKDKEYYCKKGDSCINQKAKGFSGWIVILLVVALSTIGGLVYYFSKSKVNLQDKYRF